MLAETNERTNTFQDRAVHIDWYDAEESVRVLGKDQKRFEIQKDYAIRILQVASDNKERFDKQFSLFMQLVQEWLNDNQSIVSRCVLTIRDSRMLLIAIAVDPEVNDDLEDSMSRLDLAMFRDSALDMIRVNTLVLPDVSSDSLQAFVDDRVLLVFGHK